jgi:hypothetical protein
MDLRGCRAKARPTALLLTLWLGVAGAETIGTVSSPGNVLSVNVTVNDEGRPGYSITRGARPIVTESRLGFWLTDAPKLERNFRGGDVQSRSFDETWEQPWGERRYVRNHYNELRVQLVEKNPPKRTLFVVFRAFDDGVGFRYEFPDQPQLHDVNIGEELTEFAIADPGTAWWIPGRGVESLRISLSSDGVERSRAGAHAAHDPHRCRTAYRDPRGSAGRLLGDVAASGRGHAAEGGAVAGVARVRRSSASRRSTRLGARC